MSHRLLHEGQSTAIQRESDGKNYDQPGQNGLRIRMNLSDIQPVFYDRDNGHTDDGAMYAAAAARQGSPPDDYGSDTIKQKIITHSDRTG